MAGSASSAKPTKRIIIQIESKVSEGDSKAVPDEDIPKANQGSSSSSSSKRADSSEQEGGKASKFLVQAAVNQAHALAGLVVSQAEYQFGKYTQLTEDYTTQNGLAHFKAVQNLAKSAIEPVVSYTAQGASMGGPIGAAVGFIAGVVQSGMNLINIEEARRKEFESAYEQLDTIAYSKYYYGSRAGYIDMSAGTEN